MITIETRIEVSTAVLGDIAITAVDTGDGVNLWAQLERYKPSRWSPDSGDNLEVPESFVFYTIHPLAADERSYEYEGIDITPELIARGIGLFMRAAHFNDPDLSMMDVDEADAVIQYGCFGELRYS